MIVSLWLAAVATAVRERWRGRHRGAQPGINTVADVVEFVGDLRAVGLAQVHVAPSPLIDRGPTELASRVRTLPAILQSQPTEPIPAYVEGRTIGARVVQWSGVEPALTRTYTPPLAISAAPVGTPIFDELVRDRRARERALRMPTMEMRVVFDLLTDRWLCSHCDAGDCHVCPGCSCPCRTPVLAGAR